jgi:hypothetical protein
MDYLTRLCPIFTRILELPQVYRQLRVQDHFQGVHILDLGDIVSLSYN